MAKHIWLDEKCNLETLTSQSQWRSVEKCGAITVGDNNNRKGANNRVGSYSVRFIFSPFSFSTVSLCCSEKYCGYSRPTHPALLSTHHMKSFNSRQREFHKQAKERFMIGTPTKRATAINQLGNIITFWRFSILLY